MPYLLNGIYLTLLLLAAPLLAWRSLRTGKYRQGWAAKFWGSVPMRTGDRPCVWLHAVSVGEVNLLRPLVDELCRRHADWELVISTTTRTGFELANTRYAGHTVFYSPMDFSWVVNRAMRRIRPSLLVLAELELWPNLISAAKAHGARVAIVNGRLSERSFRGYRRLRPIIARLLARLDVVAVQNAEYAERFLALGAREQNVYVTGSIKFDGAATDRHNSATLHMRALAGIEDDEVVFLAGSTQEPEERLAIETYRQLANVYPRLRLILVPRHQERFEEVARLLEESGLGWQRRTKLEESAERTGAERTGNAGRGARSAERKTRQEHARVLLVDKIGELGAWWGAARAAFVGGSLGTRGGQNMIEPAAYGAAVSFGPRTSNFRDVVAMLLAADAAVVVRNGDELTAFIRQCLAEPDFAERLGQRAQRVVLAQLGATSRTIDLLDSLLETTSPSQRVRRSAA